MSGKWGELRVLGFVISCGSRTFVQSGARVSQFNSSIFFREEAMPTNLVPSSSVSCEKSYVHSRMSFACSQLTLQPVRCASPVLFLLAGVQGFENRSLLFLPGPTP